MRRNYSAENHDWDLTLHAARELLQVGLVFDKQPTTGSLPRGFSFFTGSMVLSFAALESYAASTAFTLDNDPRFPTFDFQAYRAERAFWNKLSILAAAIDLEIDKGKGLFREIGDMQRWRNLVAHSSPYGIESTEVTSPTGGNRLHAKFRHLEYTRMVDAKHARKFYGTTLEFMRLVEEHTGRKPVAAATFQVLE